MKCKIILHIQYIKKIIVPIMCVPSFHKFRQEEFHLFLFILTISQVQFPKRTCIFKVSMDA